MSQPGPRFRRWDELEVILWIPVIAFFLLPKKNWAQLTPAGVSFYAAGDALVLVRVRTLVGSVCLHTVSTLVQTCNTLVCEVVPALALQTVDWFFPYLTNVGPLVTYIDPICDGTVCCVGVG